MKVLVLTVIISIVILAVIIGSAIAFGGPSDPAAMSSINDPFKKVNFSDLPAPSEYAARDGTKLTFRAYPSRVENSKGSVVLIHGSSARGSSMHILAQAFADAGYAAYALDVRGHGDSGIKGYVAYIGQLEDDLEDFVRFTKTGQPATLVGFSSGGGFALRFAGSARQDLFSSYLLLSPFISQDAPTYRPNSGGWVSVGLPRYIAIALLNAAGIRVFNKLPVTKFALNEEAKAFLTPQYSFALAENFRPERDFRANIRSVNKPLRVVAGQDDEAFYADQFARVFSAEGIDIPVTLVPGIGHIPLTIEHDAVQASVNALRRFNERLV